MARPSEYTVETAELFCSLIATGNLGIRRLCESHEELPEPETLYRWMRAHPEFREQYARAKDEQLQLLEDEMLTIADDAVNDYVEVQKGKGTVVLFDKEAVMRSNLRIETRKWLMGKLRPKKYGDKVAVEHDVSDSLADRIAKARSRN